MQLRVDGDRMARGGDVFGTMDEEKRHILTIIIYCARHTLRTLRIPSIFIHAIV